MKRPYRRRNYFVKKGFQGRFVLTFVLVSAIGGIIAIAVFNLLAYRKLDLMQYKIHIFTETTGQLLLRDILYANLSALVIVFFLFILTTIRIFWKITGPLYRIQTDLSKISQGDLSFSIVSRSKDPFKDFAGDLNVLIETFRIRFKDIKYLSQSLTKSVRAMEKVSDKPDMLVVETEKMIGHAKALEKELKAFNR